MSSLSALGLSGGGLSRGGSASEEMSCCSAEFVSCGGATPRGCVAADTISLLDWTESLWALIAALASPAELNLLRSLASSGFNVTDKEGFVAGEGSANVGIVSSAAWGGNVCKAQFCVAEVLEDTRDAVDVVWLLQDKCFHQFKSLNPRSTHP